MADPLSKRRAGDPLASISARGYNAMIDAARDFAQGRRLGDGGPPERGEYPNDSEVIFVRNDSGYDRDVFSIMGFGGMVFTSDGDYDSVFRYGPVFKSAAPKAWLPCCVLLEPIQKDAIGRALASGVILAKVKLTYADAKAEDNRWALPIDDDYTQFLAVSFPTSAEILYAPAAAGSTNYWCMVRLDNTRAAFWARIVKDTSSGIKLNDVRYAEDPHRNRFKYKWEQVDRVGTGYDIAAVVGPPAVAAVDVWKHPANGPKWAADADYACNTMENMNTNDGRCGNGVNMAGHLAGQEELLPIPPGAIVWMRVKRWSAMVGAVLTFYAAYDFQAENEVSDIGDSHCSGRTGQTL